jgi:tRNA pseudouridine55 synthase
VRRNGLLLINKPPGITSHDVVKKVKRLLNEPSVGHAGTLDPMATGLLVLLLGEGTKLSEYVLNGDKGYALKVQLGVTTDSLDMTGQILSQQEVQLNADTIRTYAEKLQGEFTWPVPLFSAVKVAGKKLYSYAHQNQEPTNIPQKKMEFWGLQIDEIGPDFIQAQLECSKGSFIRTWAQKLGVSLGVGGALASLVRTISAPYRLSSAVTLEQLAEDPQFTQATTQQAFVSLEEALRHWPTYTVKGKDESLLLNGQVSYDLERRLIVEARVAHAENKPVNIRILRADANQILALLQAVPNAGIKIKRVFKMT